MNQKSHYQALEQFLQAQQWREADRETTRLMVESVGKRSSCRYLDINDFQKLPEILCVLDNLWLKYSNGRFGFSVQQKIWEEYVIPYEKKWNSQTSSITYDQYMYRRFGIFNSIIGGNISPPLEDYLGYLDNVLDNVYKDIITIGRLPTSVTQTFSSYIGWIVYGFPYSRISLPRS